LSKKIGRKFTILGVIFGVIFGTGLGFAINTTLNNLGYDMIIGVTLAVFIFAGIGYIFDVA